MLATSHLAVTRTRDGLPIKGMNRWDTTQALSPLDRALYALIVCAL